MDLSSEDSFELGMASQQFSDDNFWVYAGFWSWRETFGLWLKDMLALS